MNPPSHLRVPVEPRLCEVALNLPEPSQASASGRVFARGGKPAAFAAAAILAAPWMMKALAPGLDPRYFGVAVLNMRIMLTASVPAGITAVHFAQFYTERRFGPAAFYQATMNLFMTGSALCLWKVFGVYAFAIGYAAGAWVQLGVAWLLTRSRLDSAAAAPCRIGWSEILAIIAFTRAWATHGGPGMAAALD